MFFAGPGEDKKSGVQIDSYARDFMYLDPRIGDKLSKPKIMINRELLGSTTIFPV